MRRLVIAAFVVTLALVSAASASAGRVFVLTGAGFGHGIGLSQYGAQGLAVNGWSYRQILAHYYPGTTLAGGYTATMRVLLASGRPSVTIASEAPFTVVDGSGGTFALAPGAHVVRPDLVVTDAGGVRRSLVSPATFRPGTKPLTLGGNAYRGTLRAHPSGGALSVVNHVGLEAYLKGVVPREMPSTWLALESQAVAARSYALATRATGGIFDVYADTRSQVYGGIGAETARTNAAVDATAGEILTYAGAPAVTYFFSTSGGKTAAIQDGWPGSSPVPYLVSVDDPYDSISPHHRWGPRDAETDCPGTAPDCVYTGAQISQRLGVGALDATVERNASRRVSRVTVTTATGTTSLSGPAFRTKLGLRSTWFSIGVLSLTAAKPKIVWGTSTSLAIMTRGVGGTELQARPAGGAWRTLGAVSPGATTLAVSPRVTTSYRLVSALATGPTVSVRVAARIAFSATQPRGALAGLVRPKSLAGTPVQVQRRRRDGSWATVATAAVRADGTFRAALLVRPGAYRATVVPPAGSGLVRGTSAVLTVTG